MNKPKMIQDKSYIIDQHRMHMLITLEAKKKLLLTSELIEMIKKHLSKKEFEDFVRITEKIDYNKLKELLISIYKNKCVQKQVFIG